MRNWTALVCVLLAACATPPQRVYRHRNSFSRTVFFPAIGADHRRRRVCAERPDEALSEDSDRRPAAADGSQRGLISALYQRDQLKLQYDVSMTRNASQAFDARAGNCLSLVIMTAAFAKELGLQVRYQSAYLEETWGRSGDLLVRSGHVNVTLDRRMGDRNTIGTRNAMTIDFLPAESLRGLQFARYFGRHDRRDVHEQQGGRSAG